MLGPNAAVFARTSSATLERRIVAQGVFVGALERATTATAINAAGEFVTVGVDTARIDHSTGTPALLIEAAATNLVPRSDACKAFWLQSGGGTATDLALEALGYFDGMEIESNGENFHRYTPPNTAWAAGQPYTLTAFYRAGTSGRARLNLFSNITSVNTNGNVSGTVGSLSATAQQLCTITNVVNKNLGGGDYSISFTVTFDEDLPQGAFGIGPDDATAGATVIALAMQVETGTTPTSYIPTAGTSVTRAADLATYDLSGSNLSSGYTVGFTGRLEGVAGSTSTLVRGDDGLSANRTAIHWDTGASRYLIQQWADNVLQEGSIGAATLPDGFEIGACFGPDAVQSVINGELSTLGTEADYVAPTILRVGNDGAIPVRMLIDRLILIPRPITGASLADLEASL